uniref:PWWP domain containing 3A, DNA repair factor n=1 Tax=Jaculus jaculus TaxID=51337 RepID=A0A8C5KR36_JACJA
MTDAKYVLCRWEERLWPAKVLARTETSTKNKRKKEFFLDVQILSLEEKIQVKSSAVEALQKSHIENIAALLASQQVPATPLEELTYRRSLRVALDVLNENNDEGEKPSRETACQHPNAPSPSFLPEAKVAGPRPQRQEEHTHTPQSLLESSLCEKDPECKVDPTQGLRRSGNSRALSVPLTLDGSQDGGGSPNSHKNDTLATKRQSGSGEKPCQDQTGSVLSQGESRSESDRPAGSCTALPMPSQAWEDRSCANVKGCGPCMPLPAGSHMLHPAPEPAKGRPVKRPRVDGGLSTLGITAVGTVLSPRQGTREQRTLPSAVNSPSPPEEGPPSSAESPKFSPIRSLEEEEEEEPPRILWYHEPRSFEVGMLVWLKYQKYPFWPAVVKSVRRRDKKASVLFIEGNMNPKGRGITVSLRRLKHFDCQDKHTLLDKAKEDFAQAIGWCVSLITDYRVRLGCGSFAGSFLEYYAADISYPVRKSIQQDALGTRFPQLGNVDPEEPARDNPPGRQPPCRKMLPDRSRAARDRANQKLVEYIVKAKGAESHLRAILRSRKPSRWLKTFLSSGQYVTCVETYLEDEEQLDAVVRYLQGVCRDMDSDMLVRGGGDHIRFILDVLLPEAIICAISAVDAVDYKTAEQKYIRGPTLSYREKEIFDSELLEERKRRQW